MDILHFLAELWGISLAIVSLSLLANSKNIKAVFGIAEDEKFLVVIGIINIVLGIALLIAYHTVDATWGTIVTLLSALALVRGCVILFFPSIVHRLASNLKRNIIWLKYILIATTLIGCFLIYAGAVL